MRHVPAGHRDAEPKRSAGHAPKVCGDNNSNNAHAQLTEEKRRLVRPQLKPPSCCCLLPSAALRCASNHAAGKRSKEQLKAAASKAKQILTGELTLDGDVEVRSSRHILDNNCAYPPRTFHPQDSINNLPTRIFLFIL